jgi:hypothetical protein
MRLWKCRLSPTAVGVATLLMVNAGLIAVMSWNNSPTLDELGHLAAGISYWQTARFDVYRVNPPLVRLVAAAPAALAGWELDWSGYSDTPGQRPEWQMGSDFIKLHGADALRCIRWARWACIPLSLLGAFVCYTWARQLYGAGAGWLALTLWTFAPNILAYGALITPDAAAAAMGVWAAYEFWRWLEAPRAESAFAAGLVLGLTQLSKMTWIILYPLWPCLWLAARRYGAGSWCREALQLAMIVLLSVLVLHLGYAFEDPCWQLKDYRFVSSTLTGIDPDHRAPYGGANRLGVTRTSRLLACCC